MLVYNILLHIVLLSPFRSRKAACSDGGGYGEPKFTATVPHETNLHHLRFSRKWRKTFTASGLAVFVILK